MRDGVKVEWIDRLKAESGHAARDDTIFDVNRCNAPRLQDAQQVRREIVHLLKELVIAFTVTKVSVVR